MTLFTALKEAVDVDKVEQGTDDWNELGDVPDAVENVRLALETLKKKVEADG